MTATLSLARAIGELPLALTAIDTNIDAWLSKCWSLTQVLSGGRDYLAISMFIMLTAILPTTALAIFFYCLGRSIERSLRNRRATRTLANSCLKGLSQCESARVRLNSQPGLQMTLSPEEELEEMRYY